MEDAGVNHSLDRPELADVGRLARRLVRRTVAAARADEGSVGKLLAAHLGAHGTALPVATGSWPGYDQVNVQTGLDAWLAEPGRTYELVGLTEYRHQDFGLADVGGPFQGLGRPPVGGPIQRNFNASKTGGRGVIGEYLGTFRRRAGSGARL